VRCCQAIDSRNSERKWHAVASAVLNPFVVRVLYGDPKMTTFGARWRQGHCGLRRVYAWLPSPLTPTAWPASFSSALPVTEALSPRGPLGIRVIGLVNPAEFARPDHSVVKLKTSDDRLGHLSRTARMLCNAQVHFSQVLTGGRGVRRADTVIAAAASSADRCNRGSQQGVTN